jgi:uncharacterized membrane protein
MITKTFFSTHYLLFSFLILILALLLRLVLINQSFWLDEAAQALESVRPLSQQLDIRGDFQPPLYHLAVHFFSLVSRAEWWLRLTSVIPALITIYMVMKIARLIADEKIALMTGLFLATSQFFIFYSQELRPYAFAAMWAVLSMYRLLTMVKKPHFDWQYLLFTTLGMYSVYTFPFLILAQFIMIIMFHRQLLKQFTAHWLLVAVFCLPWLPKFIEQLKTGLAVTVQLPLWQTAVSPPPLKALMLIPPKFIFGRLDLPNTLLEILPLVLILSFYFYLILKAVWPKPKPAGQSSVPIILIWLFIPVLTAFLVSFRIPVLEPKRMLFCLPALYLLIALGLSKLKNNVPIFISLILINLITLVLYWFNPAYRREPWKEAISAIESTAEPQSVLMFPWESPYAPYGWYAKKNLRTVVFERLPVTIQDINLKLSALDTRRINKIYLFDYLMDMADPGHLILTGLNKRGWSQVSYTQYPGIGKIYLYTRPPPFASSLLHSVALQ